MDSMPTEYIKCFGCGSYIITERIVFDEKGNPYHVKCNNKREK